MYSTQLRRDHIHGLLAGVAIGEALGCATQGLSRRQVLKRVGRAPLGYRLWPGIGITGPHTSLTFMSAQAMVCSAADSKTFANRFRRRLSWYLLSFPFGLDSASFGAGLKSWLRFLNLSTASDATLNPPAPRAMFCALALNGTGARIKRWVEISTSITHSHSLTSEGCLVLATLAEAASTQTDNFDPITASQELVGLSAEPEIRDRLALLTDFLRRGRSPRWVANHFGWDSGVGQGIIPTTVMAVYCFLRYPTNFRRAVESAIRLGGDTSAMGAIVGGLSGCSLGFKQLPADLLDRLSDFAYGPTWMKGMAIRLSHWPHGPDDLHSAHAEPTAVVELAVSNLMRGALILANRFLRIYSLRSVESRPARFRRSAQQSPDDCAVEA
jgi:ADP-ribosyl-[dinitrogen reductase] hydrolase